MAWLLTCLSAITFAQNTLAEPYTAGVGITESVDKIMSREVVMNGHLKRGSEENEFMLEKAQGEPLDGASFPPPANQRTDPMPFVFGSIGLQFDSANLNDSGFFPPDTMGDVGISQYLVVINGRIRVHSKTNGAIGALNTSLDTFFSSVRAGQTTGDPRVRFDRLTQRWFVTSFTIAFPNRILFAVSSGPTITGSSSFTFFGVQQDLVTPTGNTGQLFDYPTLGVDNNALYVGGNMFTSSSFIGSTLYVVRKSSILGAGPMVLSVFRNVSASGPSGLISPQGVDNDDPAATTGYFFSTDRFAFSRVVLRRVNDPAGTPSLSANFAINVPATTFPLSFMPFGSIRQVSVVDDRIMNAVIRLNPITGTRTLWAAHAIQTNGSGVGTGAGDRSSARWYEIENLSTTPTLRQAGTMVDPAASNAARFWVPSINVNGQGHMLVAGAAANPTTLRLGNAYAGRFATDPLGSTQTYAMLTTATVAYNSSVTDPMRWGDYSMTSVDPEDNMTFWTAQMYAQTTTSYAVRVYKILAPPPAPISSVSPSTLNAGTTQNVVVTGTSPSGQGFYDPGSAFPRRLTATVSGTGVTVNSFAVNSRIQVTVNISVAAGATVGPRTLTITNPDGQFVTTTITIANPIVVLNGTLTLADLIPDEDGRTVSYAVYSQTALVASGTRRLGAGGGYTLNIANLPSGSAFILFKGSHWLTKKINFTVSGSVVNNVNGTLVNGDVDGDDEVGPGDFGALATAFLSVDGDPNWNPEADLDGDGEVGPGDFSILATNFLLTGDTP